MRVVYSTIGVQSFWLEFDNGQVLGCHLSQADGPVPCLSLSTRPWELGQYRHKNAWAKDNPFLPELFATHATRAGIAVKA